MKRFCQFVMVVLGSMLLVSCDTKELNLPQLMGKTKAEVLEVVFDECPRLYAGKINIAYINDGMRYHDSQYYKTAAEALKDKKLLEANVWEMVVSANSYNLLFQRCKVLTLKFADGKVANYNLELQDRK